MNDQNIYISFFVLIPLFVAFMIPIITKVKKGYIDVFVMLAIILLMFLSCFCIFKTFTGRTFIYNMSGYSAPLGIALVLDALSVLLLLVISFAAFAATMFSISYMEKYEEKSKFYMLFLFMIAGMNGVVLSGDIFNIYVFIEVAAISSYALVAFGAEANELEASFKYLVLGSVASAFILLSIALIYGCCGTLNMAHLSNIILSSGMNNALWLSMSLLIMGLGIKAALVPFHAWLPDAHTSAPAPVSAMFSGVLIKSIGAYLIMRLIFNVFGITPDVSLVLMILGVSSIVVGGFSALGQWDYKRLLAYSTISQMGYIIFGLGIGTPLGILGSLFHLLNHAIFKPLLFLNAGSVEYSLHTRDLRELGGVKTIMPVTFLTSFIGSMSIAGIPPFNGFWSKMIIIIAGIASGHYIMSFLATLVSIVTLGYFLKLNKYIYFGNLNNRSKEGKEVPLTMCIAMGVLAIACVLIGLMFPYVIKYIINPAVQVLLDGIKYGQIVLGG